MKNTYTPTHLSLKKILEHFNYEMNDKTVTSWCGDSNSRRPTPSGPKPDMEEAPIILSNTR